MVLFSKVSQRRAHVASLFTVQTASSVDIAICGLTLHGISPGRTVEQVVSPSCKDLPVTQGCEPVSPALATDFTT